MDQEIRRACPERGLFWHPESESLFQETDPIQLERCRNDIELLEVTGDQDWERRYLMERSKALEFTGFDSRERDEA